MECSIGSSPALRATFCIPKVFPSAAQLSGHVTPIPRRPACWPSRINRRMGILIGEKLVPILPTSRSRRDGGFQPGGCLDLARSRAEHDCLVVDDESTNANTAFLRNRLVGRIRSAPQDIDPFHGAIADSTDFRINIQNDAHLLGTQSAPGVGDCFGNRRPDTRSNDKYSSLGSSDRCRKHFVGDGLDRWRRHRGLKSEIGLDCRSERGGLDSVGDGVFQRSLNAGPLRRILRELAKELG